MKGNDFSYGVLGVRAPAHAPKDSTWSARSSSAGSGVNHSQGPGWQGKPASKSDISPEITSGESSKTADSDDMVLPDGSL